MNRHLTRPLLLGTVLLLGACPGPGNGVQTNTNPPPRRPLPPSGNFVAPLLTAERTVRIGALYYRRGGGGGVSKVKIRVGPNEDKLPEVGVLEQWSGGTGGQMKSSVWVAAFMASSALGRELIDYRFSASTRGFVDGPSAGALFTAAMMAAITGARINPRATMTGTVNPDGSVGPVGGIAEKYKGALKLGYKVLGYPIGQKVQKDHQGNLVDLEELAENGGAKAYPIATIYDAYRLLTGQRAPQRFIASKVAMAMPQAAGIYLRRAAQRWRSIQVRYKTRFLKRRFANREALKRLQISQKYMRAANTMAAGNKNAAAYEFASRGASFSFTTFHYQEFLMYLKAALVTKRTNLLQVKAAKMFKGSIASKRTFDHIRKLRRPTSIDQAISHIAAYGLALENFAYLSGAKRLYFMASVLKARLKGKLSGTELKMLSRSILYMGVAQSKSLKAKHLVGLATRAGKGFNLSGGRMKKIASQVSSMAMANLGYCDTVIINSMVRRTRKPKAYWQLMLTNYLAARSNAHIARNLSSMINKGSWQWSLAELGAAVSSYLHSSMMLTKLYAVGAFAQMGGQVRTVRRAEAMLAMLRHASIRARQSAARARKTVGYIPLMSRYFFEVGEAMRKSGQTMQVKALEMYWRSALLSQIAVMLSRAS
jgi:uncharacterized protein